MYGIIRTNATLWAGNKIFFFIFKRAKRQEIKLIQSPNNLLVIIICWLLTKKILSGLYLWFFSFKYNSDEMQGGNCLPLKTGLVLTQEKRISCQDNEGILQFTQENHLHSSFSSLNSTERNKSWGFFSICFSLSMRFWAVWNWPNKGTFVTISRIAE